MHTPLHIWIKAAAISTLAVFAPTGPTLIAMFAMVAVDLVTGLMRAHATGQKIESNGLKRTVIKLVAYELAVVLAFVCERWLTGDLLPLVKMAAGACGLVEFLSVLENLNVLSNGALRPLLDRLNARSDKTPPSDSGGAGPAAS